MNIRESTKAIKIDENTIIGGSNDVLIQSMCNIKTSETQRVIEQIKECTKLVNKYSKKLKNNELERKVIETLVAKGYNYKSVKDIVERMIEND